MEGIYDYGQHKPAQKCGRPEGRSHPLWRLGNQQSLRDWPRLCRGRLQLILAHRCGVSKTSDFAIQEAKETSRPLYVLFVREQAVLTPEDRDRKWQHDL